MFQRPQIIVFMDSWNRQNGSSHRNNNNEIRVHSQDEKLPKSSLGNVGMSAHTTCYDSPASLCILATLRPLKQVCTLGCFINYTLQKKKMQYQYAPLTGVYKPDMKEFFS